ncbi:MAG: CPBP family intramembrane metalloprotease [Bdellovibrio sp.]|nr:CPBP family intramembrane metalloprotease [Bdellovibrio sp.]
MTHAYFNLKKLTRHPGFWIFQLVLFGACILFCIQYFSQAFPTVDLKIQMDRKGALKRARELSDTYSWAPKNSLQTASFGLDQMTQTFVELSSGGSQAFKKLLQDHVYFPYTWEVRNFAQGETHESRVYFTPDGDFYGFAEKIPEDQKGPALSANEARKIAEESLKKVWALDLSPFKLVENTQEKKLSGRIDHLFIYERDKVALGEGKFRFALEIRGDRLSFAKHFVKIPDEFIRKYHEMRSFNDTLAGVASILMAVLYLGGGVILGLFFLGRIRWVVWKTPVFCGVFVSALQALERVNQLPLHWMSYDTAIGTREFLISFASGVAQTFVLDGLLLVFSFMAAESLTRKAFPEHPQLWRVWARGNLNSVSVLGRTVGGYLTVGIFAAYVVFAYYFGTRYLNWWNPSESLYQPNSLASYFPFLTPLANSLHAGFWEECLFRAIPIASAALLGNRFGGRKKWIAGAFLLQALIFAAAHANYPAQPYYARLVELIFPSLLFGSLYLTFGLLPGIILHFTFDVVCFALPIFSADTPGVWIDKLGVILLGLIPLWIVLLGRLRAGKWSSLSRSQLNESWTPGQKKRRDDLHKDVPHEFTPPKATLWIPVGILGGVVLLGMTFFFPIENDAPKLNLSRKDAVSTAEAILKQRGVHLEEGWQPLASVSAETGVEDRFVWRTEGQKTYRRMTKDTIDPPTWNIRFVRFQANPIDRAEEYLVRLGMSGKLIEFKHILPESRPGAKLSQAEAFEIAKESLVKEFGSVATASYKKVSSSSSKLPNRVDWMFVFSDTRENLKSGDARVAIVIAGNEPAAWGKFIFVPEEWQRSYRAEKAYVQSLKPLAYVALICVSIFGMIFALINWSKKRFAVKTFIFSFTGLLLIETIDLLNSLPSAAAGFSTALPKYNQLANFFLFGGLKVFSISSILGLLAGYVTFQSRRSKTYATSLSATLGYGTGLIGAGWISLIFRVFPSESPTWGKFDGLDYYLPVLRPLQSLMSYFPFTALCLVVVHFANHLTRHWTHQRKLGVLLLTGFSFCVCAITAESLSVWVGLSLGLAVFSVLTYSLILRTHLSLVPLATASVSVVQIIKQIRIHPYTGGSFHGVLGIALVLITSWIWFRSLRVNESFEQNF